MIITPIVLFQLAASVQTRVMVSIWLNSCYYPWKEIYLGKKTKATKKKKSTNTQIKNTNELLFVVV